MNYELRIKNFKLIACAILLFIILLSTFYFLLSAIIAFAANPQELKEAIYKKNTELQKVNSQIQEIEDNLESVKKEGKTLKKEILKIDSQVKQLNLGIQSSEITIEKLGFEIDSLQYQIADSEEKIINKRKGVIEILRILQEKDRENTLAVLLKNKTLSDSVLEVQNINNLSGRLNNEISELNFLKDDLSEKLKESSNKKKNKETENFTLKNKKSIVEDIKKSKESFLEITKNQEKNFQSQLSELEKQQLAISDAIGDLEDELRRSFDASLLPIKRPGVFAWPIKIAKDGGIGRITQYQGEVSRLYKGKPHNGLDIGAPLGTPVYAAEDGKVEAVDNNDRSYHKKYQYGKYIFIKHNNNMSTLYAHLSKQVVRAGDIVKRGDLIGYSGNTGYSTGAHLHFGVYWSASVLMKSVFPANGLVPIGVIINPEDYL
ncbi:peptidoglycan DD-metalloendopeptidase family protein [Candidatus Wolfebacteria bacterium]|nr:peptidoglycan DD-metalloendopeptidase family protein [Candidatus Wolfebacteria bacterium]